MTPSGSPAARFRTSGDVLADRRHVYACELAARGDHAAAAELLQQALERAPDFAAAWFALGETQEALRERGAAIAAFERALACDPQDRQGARLRLARLGVGGIDAMSPAYVAELFDQYAPRFDGDLTRGLNYRGPDLLLRAIGRARAAQGAPPDFARALDLGCGTGLMGERLRPHARFLAGVDLSAGMIAAARRKRVYDRLAVGDLADFLIAEAAGDERYDLVTAADVFVYLADLAPVCAAAARALAPGGLLAFSVETHAGEGVVLGEKLRYAHGEAHLRAALAAADLNPLSIAAASTRTEGGSPVRGLVVVARRGDLDSLRRRG